jgi:hypothetical protein
VEGSRAGEEAVMEIRGADRDAIVNELDKIIMQAAALKAAILEYKTPVCSNRDLHPHGAAGQCLKLP